MCGGLFAGMHAAADAAPTASRETRAVCGWSVHIACACLATNAAATERALELLKSQLDEIVSRVPQRHRQTL